MGQGLTVAGFNAIRDTRSKVLNLGVRFGLERPLT